MLLLFVLSIISCNKVDKSNLPYAYVNFKVDLAYKDRDLLDSLRCKIFTQRRLDGEFVGFSGILVICGFTSIGTNDYYAYEICCPYEAKKEIMVVPNDDGTATCPECGSVYDIANGNGARMTGPSPFDLRRFDVSKVGNDLYIRFGY